MGVCRMNLMEVIMGIVSIILQYTGKRTEPAALILGLITLICTFWKTCLYFGA